MKEGFHMAENDQSVRDNDNGGGFLGMVGAVISGAASMAGKVWDAVMEDGTIAAAGRQGLDELGQALKAFPDSIQGQAYGTMGNPLQSEIAADRDPWPSEIAAQNRNLPVNGNSNSNGNDAGYSM
jgi:hypothetical protein